MERLYKISCCFLYFHFFIVLEGKSQLEQGLFVYGQDEVIASRTHFKAFVPGYFLKYKKHQLGLGVIFTGKFYSDFENITYPNFYYRLDRSKLQLLGVKLFYERDLNINFLDRLNMSFQLSASYYHFEDEGTFTGQVTSFFYGSDNYKVEMLILALQPGVSFNFKLNESICFRQSIGFNFYYNHVQRDSQYYGPNIFNQNGVAYFARLGVFFTVFK